MARIEIYTTPVCPFCVRAKALLKRKGAEFLEVDMGGEDADWDKMIARSQGRRTVPQIFINDRSIGGCDELYALDRAGNLDALLQEESS
ncbi:MAG: glutaredoxin 3 [Alphaproteobacteria bacterium RIFOXYD12_FULL_60_8]|nr:MAG: glutaredoxin 3 [Alphaproteobacteria bacterium RIFOXYD12_FULL_60_8]